MTYALRTSLAGAVLLLISPALLAQKPSASGSLTVSASVEPSILEFASDNLGVMLASGAGTNLASIAFGHINSFSSLPDYVSRTVAANSFTVSTPVDILVLSANTTSGSYKLTAALNLADNVNGWNIDSTAIATGAATLTTTGQYGRAMMHTFKLTVPFSGTAASISNAINFVPTAN